ncbi:MAG: uracil-DNA glycosylase [Myxococcota bacterium]|jgi:uracil-DNA glycosylase
MTFDALRNEVARCRLCEAHLPLGPRPIVQLHPGARILIAGQAPGRRAHLAGVPFDDPSGERLRSWLGVSRETFYNPEQVAILPMGFCFPGTGKSGDLPPRPECAPAWRAPILAALSRVELTVVLGAYAQRHHLGGGARTVTARVRDWQASWPAVLPLPHPSPRNNIWLRRNPWFEHEVLPVLRERVSALLLS